MIGDSLAADHHINIIVGKTVNLLRNIWIVSVYLDEEMMRKQIVTMICQKLNVRKFKEAHQEAEDDTKSTNKDDLSLKWDEKD